MTDPRSQNKAPQARPSRRRGLRIALLGSILLIWILAGVHVPPRPGEIHIVAWRTGHAWIARGWSFAPPLIARRIVFPEGESLAVTVPVGEPRGESRLLSREGAGVFARVALTAAPDRDNLAAIGRAFPRGWDGSTAAARLAPAIAEDLSDFAKTRSITEILMTRGGLSSLEDAAGREARALGLRVLDRPRASFYPRGSVAGTDGSDRGVTSGRRVLLIGLDGADWDIIDPLIAQGRMPNLATLVAEGVRARLRTLTPSLSPIVWTSIATGVGPAQHGILDFVVTHEETGEVVPVTSNLRRRKALWNILGAAGRTSGVVAWWATWPAEPVEGFIVSDRVAYQLFGLQEAGDALRRRTWPESLDLVIRRHVVTPADIEDEAIDRYIPPEHAARAPDVTDHVQRLKTILASSRTYVGIARDLLAAYDPDFKAVYLEGTDTVAHNFMRYRPPAMTGVTPEALAAYGGVVDEYYERADEILGDLLALADARTVVIVCSDHGFRTGANRPLTDPRIEVGGAADWHRRFGVIVLKGPGIARGQEIPVASVLDIAPTVLALMGIPVADDMEGEVIERAFVMAPAVERVATHEDGTGPGDATPLASTIDEEMIARLSALGYISQQGGNALNNTGITLLEQGRYPDAARAFRQALEAEPGFIVARINLGRALILLKDHDEALRVLEETLRLDDTIPDVSNLIANIHMEQGAMDRAERTLRAGLKRHPEDTNLLNSLGLLYERMGKDEEAIRSFRRVVEIDPDYAEGYNNLGLTHRRRGETLEAIALFERAIEAEPNFPGSYNNMGLAYQDLGRLEEARGALERGIAVDPENTIMINSLGTVLLDLGDTDAAGRQFERALAIDPEYAAPHNNLAAILAATGNPEAALGHYRRAIAIDPAYLDARYNLANLLMSRGEEREAAVQFEEILQRDPSYVNAWLQLGYLRLRQGEDASALELATGALARAPDAVEPHNLLADIHLSAGRIEEARLMLSRSLALNPAQPIVRRALEGLPPEER